MLPLGRDPLGTSATSSELSVISAPAASFLPAITATVLALAFSKFIGVIFRVVQPASSLSGQVLKKWSRFHTFPSDE